MPTFKVTFRYQHDENTTETVDVLADAPSEDDLAARVDKRIATAITTESNVLELWDVTGSSWIIPADSILDTKVTAM
ncbi:hypothetical protein C9F11_38335 [Streptomyces sp. YIM 121038]|uniref:hypothetical protein n=1 Tax=Streptomyces sp. YIM 121038 TaxID=2136401 RepID=UPI001110437C|nr:hypothetical protein [Streptomyces sp. YIM 121038]QCX81250.1 hypothetical protein C9F11_38335 [Streptomyces sp. YIM 121038]